MSTECQLFGNQIDATFTAACLTALGLKRRLQATDAAPEWVAVMMASAAVSGEEAEWAVAPEWVAVMMVSVLVSAEEAAWDVAMQ